jgi:hypothetical protein
MLTASGASKKERFGSRRFNLGLRPVRVCLSYEATEAHAAACGRWAARAGSRQQQASPVHISRLAFTLLVFAAECARARAVPKVRSARRLVRNGRETNFFLLTLKAAVAK